LRIVYRYLSSCRSELTNNPDGGVVHFRHAASAKWTGGKKAKKVGIPDVQNPAPCGQNEDIGVGSFSWDPDESEIDTQSYRCLINTAELAARAFSLSVPFTRNGNISFDPKALMALLVLLHLLHSLVSLVDKSYIHS
jgi:hypothetical protein